VAFAGSGPVAVPVRPGEHACCHFADAHDRERLTVAFVRDRLRRGDKVVCFFDDDDAAGLMARLERMDPAFESAMARGQFEVRGARDAYIRDGRFDAERMLALFREEHDRARAEGYGGLSLTGQVPHAICELPGGEQLGSYEARLMSDIGGLYCSSLCQYDHGRFGTLMSDVIEAHEVDASPDLAAIGRDGDLAAARDRRRGALRLAGELDFGCAQTVSEVLDVHFDGPRRLDLADLSYVDVAGMRALRGRKRGRLTISPASHAVRRLTVLLAWDTDPEIELLEAG
jgi:ABC-type transporter Mla MlaB component